MLLLRSLGLALVAAISAHWGAVAAAQEVNLKIALGQRGNWESAVPELGQRAGIFKKHGLVVDILWTQGGGETQMAVISGAVDVGHGIGTGGVMGAYAKGAPVRVIANATTGASDLSWYVPTSSPIKTLKDGKTIAYSTTGSSTHLIVLGFIKQFGLTATPVATGSPTSTFTQTMSGQVDIGWSSPQIAARAIEDGKIRIIAYGSDIPSVRDQTVRIQIVNSATLAAKRDAIRRYVDAYRETIDWMYSDPAALKLYAEWANLPESLAKRIRDEFFPKDTLLPGRLSGLDAAMEDAITLKFLAGPLSKGQLDELFVFMNSK
jgi:NitT/TauT family transport system substrate-binding protein